MIISAKATNLRNTPRKVNLVVKSIVGMHADKAIEKLTFSGKRAAVPVIKVIKQGVANAVHNYQLSASSLIIDTAFATKGRLIKGGLFGGRMHFKPFERVSSHLTINLRSAATAAPKAAAKPAKAAALPEALPVEAKKKPAAKKTKASISTKQK